MYSTLQPGVVDKTQDPRADGHAFESSTSLFFIFQFENILQSNTKFSSSYGH